ncbi:MAG: putative baseplate assembly protein [Aliishimia sp.]
MLPQVNLADLSAEELAAEMVRRIPAHTPEWRNARSGDPGRALIDLFAWMGEAVLYRANLTPRRMRLEFLNLLNMKQNPALPATGLVQLGHKASAAASSVFVGQTTRLNGPVPFETLSPITAQPFEGHAFIKRRLSEEEQGDLSDVIASLGQVYGLDDIAPYASEKLFGPDSFSRPDGIDPLAESLDQTLWIGLFALDDKPAARTSAIAALDDQPCLLNIGIIPQMSQAEGEASQPVADGLQWSVSSMDAAGELRFLDVAIDDDRTSGLSAEGTLRLVLPRADLVGAPSNDIVDEIDAGVGDRPPRLDDPDLATRLIGWLRLRADDAADRLPLSWVGINAVMADQRETFANMLLGTATGQAGMRFALPAGNLDPDSLQISVFEHGLGFQTWDRASDLGACGREDRCFELDAESGEVVFGDDLTGKGLPAGTRVRLDVMRAGGGIAGNLAKGALAKIERPGLNVHQPSPMHGGVDAETLEAAEKRVSASLHHRNRCVTEEDYKEIGAEMGLARLEVIPGFRPHTRLSNQAGVIAVMAVPDAPVRRPDNPRADRRLLERIHAHLDPRRPLGTELYVISPEYVSLGISVALTTREGFAREEVVRAVKDRLYTYLWPLIGGGLDQKGWALGRDVRNLDVEVELARVPGVQTVTGVNVFGQSEIGFTVVPTQAGTGLQTLPVEIWQLPELLHVDVAVGLTAPSTTLDGLNGGSNGLSDNTGRPVAVPIVPEVC